MEDGSFSTDQETILKRRKSEYYKLFKRDNTLVNYTFIDNLSELTDQLERELDSVNKGNSSITDEDDESLAVELCNENMSVEETEETMRLVKLGKAVGVDNLLNKILCNTILTVPLQKLFDMCFTHGIVPSPWCQSIIYPIFKGGKDCRDQLGYLGISLMSTVAKMFSSILNRRLTSYFERNNTLCNYRLDSVR
ncbi:Hypothetical predicted protein [Mytilus galloprovincialis]|uniref:Reverse transcriptase domain-containing protein n=1 Tax=Mytilus galloprovincialis TaxID=29158 RepID=A0A8B6BSY3_MYTGA|nr:Hypothetical predicted protein [Mytilus galloprovincialis]